MAFQNVVTLTGATQFAAATPVATFLEQVSVTTLGPTVYPRILGYSYNSLGAAATVTLRLSPAPASALNLQVDLETPTTVVNSVSTSFGKSGIIVPRLYGRTNSASQAIDTVLGAPNNAAPLVLLFVTVGKDNTGTFRVWWDYVDLGGAN
jgi:hypothetical protein